MSAQQSLVPSWHTALLMAHSVSLLLEQCEWQNSPEEPICLKRESLHLFLRELPGLCPYWEGGGERDNHGDGRGWGAAVTFQRCRSLSGMPNSRLAQLPTPVVWVVFVPAFSVVTRRKAVYRERPFIDGVMSTF